MYVGKCLLTFWCMVDGGRSGILPLVCCYMCSPVFKTFLSTTCTSQYRLRREVMNVTYKHFMSLVFASRNGKNFAMTKHRKRRRRNGRSDGRSGENQGWQGSYSSVQWLLHPASLWTPVWKHSGSVLAVEDTMCLHGWSWQLWAVWVLTTDGTASPCDAAHGSPNVRHSRYGHH